MQRAFNRELDARWALLKKTLPSMMTARTDLANTIAHAAATGQDTVRAFQTWFDRALKTLVVGDGRWMARYLREAADGALLRSNTLTQPLAVGGVIRDGEQAEFFYDAVKPRDRIPPLQTLAHVELQGIAEAVSQQAVRVFTDGLLTRKKPAEISRDVQAIIDNVGVRRSHMLVSFMVVRAFSIATLDAFRAAGVSSVGTVAERVKTLDSSPKVFTRDAKKKSKSRVKKPKPKNLVEVLTAGDNKVCQQCEDISEEGPYTLAEAEGLIPAHIHCRCAFVPWHDARFASVHDDKDALGHGSFAHALHHVAHHVGHHIGHHVKHIFKGEHSHEEAHAELEKEGYVHESTTEHAAAAAPQQHVATTSVHNNNRIRVGQYSHPHGHRAKIHTEKKIDENGDPVIESTVSVQRKKQQQQQTEDADFDESKHPRDKAGRWSTVSGKVSKDEKQALEDYTGGYYKDINPALFKGRAPKFKLYGKMVNASSTVKNLDKFLSRSVMKHDATVYRGIRARNKDLTIDAFEKNIGKEITMAGYVSTSRSRAVAQRFAKGVGGAASGAKLPPVLMKITVPKGANAYDTGPAVKVKEFGFSFVSNEEQEVLLPRNSKFKVTKIDRKANTVHLEMLKKK